MILLNQQTKHNLPASPRPFMRVLLKPALSLPVTLAMAALTLPAHAAITNTTNTANKTDELSSQATNQTTRQTANQSLNLPTNSPTDALIAVVGDTPILLSELNQAVDYAKAQLQAQGRPIPPLDQLKASVLNSLIKQQLQLDMVKRVGIRPNTEAVNQRLMDIAKSQGVSSLVQLQQLMDRKTAGSYANLRNAIIEEESIKTLQQRQIANRVRITEQDVDAFLASPESKTLIETDYRTIHIRVPFIDDYDRISDEDRTQAMKVADIVAQVLKDNSDVKTIMTVLSEQIGDDYPLAVQGGDMGYHPASALPTTISDVIINLNVGEVAQPQITPQGIDVVKLVDKRGSQDMVIDQWRVRHILIKPDANQSDALAKQQIEELYEQLRRDADFASLAATYSDDAGSAGRGGDLDWVSEGQMVPEFETMMKRTTKGDFSVPFASQFGWHILKVEDIRKQDVSETIKRNLAKEALYNRLAPQAQEDWLQELEAMSYVKVFEQAL